MTTHTNSLSAEEIKQLMYDNYPIDDRFGGDIELAWILGGQFIYEHLRSSDVGVINEFAEQLSKVRAIAFAEWISAEGYQQYDGHNRWIAPHQSNDVYETPALYDLYTQKKQKI